MSTEQRTRRAGRHQAPRAMGPVTAANKVLAYRPRHRASSLALRAWPAVPVLFLVYPAMHGRLMTYADSVVGFDALLCLVACLTVTPVITVSRRPVARLRWWYGNWVFFLGAAGLALHLLYGAGGPAYRITGTAADWSGTLIIALLLPMTATSSVLAQKLLGPEWKRWQRVLVWSVWAITGLHLFILAAWLPLAAYAAAAVPSVVLRERHVRKSVSAWRRGGYSTGLWWAALALLVTLAVSGTAVLAAEEVRAIAASVAGT